LQHWGDGIAIHFDTGVVPWRTCGMTVSASTPRIRITQVWYGIVLVLVAVSERSGFDGYGGYWAGVAGFLLMMTAVLCRVWTSAHIAGHKDAQLITFGPYSVCRHPLYAFSLVGGLGIGLASSP
jgi:protein-S-isoprenylcysteine O-methyltransferase Ste14